MPDATMIAGNHPAPSLKRRQITLVAAASLGLVVSYPALIAMTYIVFMNPLSDAFGERVVPSFGIALATLGQAVGALLVGRFIRRWGAVRVLLAGIPVFAALVASLAVIPINAPIFLLVNFAIGLASCAAGVGVYLSLLNLWFDRHLGRAIGFALLGMSIGMLVLPVGVQLVLAALGWRLSYLLLAALTFLIGMVTTLILLRQGEAPLAHVGATEAGIGIAVKDAIRTSTFWAIAIAAFVATVASFGVANHSVLLYRDAGLSVTELFQVTLLLGIGSIAGRFGLGLIIDRVHAPFAVAGIFIAAALASLYLASSGVSPWAIFFIGLALGAESDVLPFLVRRYFGSVDHAVIYNRVLSVTYLGGFAGPPLMAASFSAFGSYQASLIFAAVCFLASAAMLGRLKHYPYPAIAAPDGAE